MAITSFICAVHAGRAENRRQPPESTPISPAQRRIGHGYSKPGKRERKAPCTWPWTLRGGERGFPTSPHSQTRAGQLRGEQACEKGGVITPTGCELSRDGPGGRERLCAQDAGCFFSVGPALEWSWESPRLGQQCPYCFLWEKQSPQPTQALGVPSQGGHVLWWPSR